jgi:cytochrome c-type biogenesis protein CcmH/NrfG
MLPRQPIPTPALCRLCRRPIARAAVKCPYCGARLSWSDRARAGESRRSRRGWLIAACVAALIVLVAAAVLWLSVLREIKAPISAEDNLANPAGRLSATECADLIAGLTKPSATDQRLPAELRNRLRQCFDRR